MFKYILMDIDGTLLDFEKCACNAFLKTAKTLGLNFNEDDYAVYSKCNDKYWKKYEKHEISQEELKIKRFDETFDILCADMTGEKFNPIYGENLSMQYIKTDGADDILDYLQGKYELWAVTNGIARTQHIRLKKSGLDKYFKYIFISEEIGANKPNKAYFDRCFEITGVTDKSKCLLIGDSLTSDMRGAYNAGIKKCWYEPTDNLTLPDFDIEYRIKELPEIKNIL